jgi:hypothetical protein
MGGEAVSERMAAHRPLHTGSKNGAADCLLHGRLVEMVPADDPTPRIGAAIGRRKDILPAPFLPRIRVLPSQCMRKPHFAEAGLEVCFVEPSNPDEMFMKRLDDRSRKHGPAVHVPFPLTDEDDSCHEIDVLDPQAKRLEQPQARSVKNGGDQVSASLPVQRGSGERRLESGRWGVGAACAPAPRPRATAVDRREHSCKGTQARSRAWFSRRADTRQEVSRKTSGGVRGAAAFDDREVVPAGERAEAKGRAKVVAFWRTGNPACPDRREPTHRTQTGRIACPPFA